MVQQAKLFFRLVYLIPAATIINLHLEKYDKMKKETL